MINEIISGLSVALNGEFGDNYEICMEEMKQDLKEPCFFIFCMQPKTDLFFGKKYFKKLPICIQYFPSRMDKNAECYDVAERMEQCLEYVRIGTDLMRGTEMSYEVVEGVLFFYVHYDYFVYRKDDTVAMESIETNVRPGGEKLDGR